MKKVNEKAAVNPRATVETNMGNITIELYPNDVPKTAANFIGLAKKGYYNGVIFHRVVSGFVIQGGDPTGTGRGGDSIYGGEFEDELNPNTESYQRGYLRGAAAMANRGPDTNSSQFFIMLEDKSLPKLYTIFGKVIEGDDVVQNIGQARTDANDKPLEPVIINKVTIQE
ncbi:MAG: peptidylprolyl isomerase [Patescibacteria group bacterium]